MDVRQCNGDLVVTAELPGLKKEDVKVELTDDSLVIQGERKHEHKEDHEGFHSFERSYGQFYRSIPLPDGAKPKADMAKADRWRLESLCAGCRGEEKDAPDTGRASERDKAGRHKARCGVGSRSV